jgi:hypothetical protein
MVHVELHVTVMMKTADYREVDLVVGHTTVV